MTVPAPVRGDAAAQSVFGEMLVLRAATRADGCRMGLPLEYTEDVTRAVRGALLRHAEDPPPAVLSGHAPDGCRLERPHVAFVALADVRPAAAGADSHRTRAGVLGAGILMPRGVSAEGRRAVLASLNGWERAGLRVVLGAPGALRLERLRLPELGPLHPRTWTGPSRCWASATPVALHRNPGRLLKGDSRSRARAVGRAEESVARACEHIGLPPPAAVRVMYASRFRSAPPAAPFAPYPRKGQGLRRLCVHVELHFSRPVAGPVLLGAGRYFGVGLCAPCPDGDGPA